MHIKQQRVRPRSCPPPSSQPSAPRNPQRHLSNASIPDTSPLSSPTFGPHVKHHLMRAYLCHYVDLPVSAINLPKTRCSICTDELAIAGLQPDDGESDKEAGALACNHLIGMECATSWCQHDRENGQRFSCPQCRCDLDPPRCIQHKPRVLINLSLGDELGFLTANDISTSVGLGPD